VHDVTLYGHRGRYRLQSTLHYALTAGGWKAVRSSSMTYWAADGDIHRAAAELSWQ